MTRRFTHTLLAGALLATSAGFAQAETTLTIACGSVGQDYDSCKHASDQWARKTGNQVRLLSVPVSSTETLGLYQKMFAAGSSDVDVVMVDVVWPGIIGQHLLDLTPYAKDEVKKHFPAIIANNTVQGRLVAMPWFTAVGLLYYRKDLLEKYELSAPTTWDEFAKAAATIQEGERKAGREDFQGFVWQGRPDEGLTCDALEWVHSQGGGTIVNEAGEITIDNENAARALDRAADWVGTLSPQGVLGHAEEDARALFQNGKAAFMRNWPYAWALVQGANSRVKDKVGVAPLPAGENGSTATLGGWQLAVSKYTKHPEEAADLVMYLTSEKVQKRRAIEGAYNPTYPALYKDKDVLAANPFFGTLYDVLPNAVSRPSSITGPKYDAVSQAFWSAVHDVLNGRAKGAEAVKKLQERLGEVKKEQWQERAEP